MYIDASDDAQADQSNALQIIGLPAPSCFPTNYALIDKIDDIQKQLDMLKLLE